MNRLNLNGIDELDITLPGLTTTSVSSGILAVINSGFNGVNDQTGISYTIQSSDNQKLVVLSNAAAVAVTLPAPTTAGFGDKFVLWISNNGAGLVTITPASSTIDGNSSLELETLQGVVVFTDGTNYFTSRGISVPGGSSPQVQYNNSGVFGGVTGATSDGTNLLVTTQASADSSTKSASTAFVSTAISNAVAHVAYTNVANTFTTGPQTVQPTTDVAEIQLIRQSDTSTHAYIFGQNAANTSTIWQINHQGWASVAYLEATGNIPSGAGYVANTAVLQYYSGDAYLESVGPNTTTYGGFYFRGETSTSAESPIIFLQMLPGSPNIAQFGAQLIAGINTETAASTPKTRFALVTEGQSGITYPGYFYFNTWNTGLNRGTEFLAIQSNDVASGTSTNLLQLQGEGTLSVTHLNGLSGTPTIGTQGGLGGGTATLTAGSTDLAGQFTLVSGTAAGGDAGLCTVTFSQAYQNTVIVVISPANYNAANNSVWVFNPTSTDFQIASGSGGVAASTTYVWNYVVVQLN